MMRPPEHQVAGHQAAEGQMGPLVDGARLFYKPLQGDDRGAHEVAFYSSFSSDPRVPPHFRAYFPGFHGTQLLSASDGSGPHPHLVLDDLAAGLHCPSIIDIKIGDVLRIGAGACHELGIVCIDLKPENVLIQENGHLMLIDFDLSTKLLGRSQEPLKLWDEGGKSCGRNATVDRDLGEDGLEEPWWNRVGLCFGMVGSGTCGLCCCGLDLVTGCRRSPRSSRTRGRISCAGASSRILRTGGLPRCC